MYSMSLRDFSAHFSTMLPIHSVLRRV